MDFKTVGKTGTKVVTPKKDLPVNLAVRLTSIETFQDRASQFVGFNAATGESVRVQLMTIEEGIAVNVRSGEALEVTRARLQGQYAGTGEAKRPRATDFADPKHKTHCATGGLMMFTKALQGADGVFRAHWAETLESTAGAGCDMVTAHIRFEDIRDKTTKEVIDKQVVADIAYVDKAVILNGENTIETLKAAFANVVGEQKVKPFIHVRLVEAESGKVLLNPVQHATYVGKEMTDFDTGNKFTQYDAADAETSITALMGADNETRDGLVIRAALFALTDNEGTPEYKVDNPDLLDDLNKITEAVRKGALLVEVIPGERVAAGPAAKASLVKAAKTQPNHPINTLYSKRNDAGFTVERRFTPTYLTTKVGKDGHRFFTKFVSADCFPKMVPMERVVTSNDLKGLAAASKERVAQDEAAPFDPSALDGSISSEVNEGLRETLSR